MRLSLLIADFAYKGPQRVCIFESSTPGDHQPLRGQIGRDRQSRFCIHGDNAVSRAHFEVWFKEGRFYIRNLSRNGTMVVDRAELREVGQEHAVDSNDRLIIGSTEIMVTILPGAVSTTQGATTSPTAGSQRIGKSRRGASAAQDKPEEAATSLGRPERRLPSVNSLTGELRLIEESLVDIQLPEVPQAKRNRHDVPEDLDLEVLLGLVAGGDAGSSREESAASRGTGGPAGAADAASTSGDRRRTGSEARFVWQVLEAAGVGEDRKSAVSQVDAVALGRLLSTLIAAISNQMSVRASFKRTFRLATTEIKATGNNPLRLPLSPGEILADLLDPPPGFLEHHDAVRDAALDLQVHQAAVADCIRSSFESLIDFLDPRSQEVQEGEAGGGSLLSQLTGSKGALAWKKYSELYQQNFGDRHRAFMRIYLERFGRDYHAAIAKVSSESGGDKKGKKGKS